MSMTRVEAEQVVKEALEQDWEGDKHIVRLDDGQEYNEGRGRVYLHDWDEINQARRELGNGTFDATGCTVELHFPGEYGLKYWITSTDDWRKLKAKVDELREIIKQAASRGWEIPHFSRPQKVGKLGMMIEVLPPGNSHAYPVRVGGMRTWRKLCREHDTIIDQSEVIEHKELHS